MTHVLLSRFSSSVYLFEATASYCSNIRWKILLPSKFIDKSISWSPKRPQQLSKERTTLLAAVEFSSVVNLPRRGFPATCWIERFCCCFICLLCSLVTLKCTLTSYWMTPTADIQEIYRNTSNSSFRKEGYQQLTVVFCKLVNSNFRAFWLAPVTRISLAIHCFATGAKMASRFKTFSVDEIWAINEAVVQRNTKKATNFGLSVFTGT